MEHGEHEPQVGRDRALLREELCDLDLEAVMSRVDLVVEGDHRVAELDVLRLERAERPVQRTLDDRPELLEIRLEGVKALLVLDAHQPKRPVT